MLGLGLTTAVHAEYLLTLASPHPIKVTVQVLDNNHAVQSTITQILLDGQIDAVVATATDDDVSISRTARMQLLDPTRTMTFDSNSPADGAIYMDRMVRIIYSVRCPSQWVDVPVFTGPVTKCDRDGDIVNIEAQGKEVFGLRAAFWPTTMKGRKTDVIKALLVRSGEAYKYIDVPDSTSPLVGSVTLARDSKHFLKAFQVTRSMNRFLMYDGRGIARSVLPATTSVAVIRSGNGGLLRTDPQINFDSDSLVNAVRVVGGKPKGAKAPVEATVVAPNSHPLSPLKIGRSGGLGGHLLHTETNANLRTTTAARRLASSLLASSLAQQIEVSYDCLPIPHLEPFDMVTVATDHFNLAHRVGRFSLPLKHSGLMSIGYNTNLTAPRRPVRRA